MQTELRENSDASTISVTIERYTFLQLRRSASCGTFGITEFITILDVHFLSLIRILQLIIFVGGVFIATLFGLGLAMITLAGEVIYYRKRNVSQKGKQDNKRTARDIENEKIILQKLASGLDMKAAPSDAFFKKELGHMPRVSHISVYPRHFPFKE